VRIATAATTKIFAVEQDASFLVVVGAVVGGVPVLFVGVVGVLCVGPVGCVGGVPVD